MSTSNKPIILHGENTDDFYAKSITNDMVLTREQVLSLAQGQNMVLNISNLAQKFVKLTIQKRGNEDGSYHVQFANEDQYLSGADNYQHSEIMSLAQDAFGSALAYNHKITQVGLNTRYTKVLEYPEYNEQTNQVNKITLLIPVTDNDTPDVGLDQLMALYTIYNTDMEDPINPLTQEYEGSNPTAYNIGEFTVLNISKQQMESVYHISEYDGWSEAALANPQTGSDKFLRVVIEDYSVDLADKDIWIAVVSKPDYYNIDGETLTLQTIKRWGSLNNPAVFKDRFSMKMSSYNRNYYMQSYDYRIWASHVAEKFDVNSDIVVTKKLGGSSQYPVKNINIFIPTTKDTSGTYTYDHLVGCISNKRDPVDYEGGSNEDLTRGNATGISWSYSDLTAETLSSYGYSSSNLDNFPENGEQIRGFLVTIYNHAGLDIDTNYYIRLFYNLPLGEYCCYPVITITPEMIANATVY